MSTDIHRAILGRVAANQKLQLAASVLAPLEGYTNGLGRCDLYKPREFGRKGDSGGEDEISLRKVLQGRCVSGR